MRDQLPMRRIVELQRLQHLELAVGLAGISDLVVGLAGRRRDELVGAKSLEFNDVGAGIGRRIDQCQGNIEPAVMIDASFRNDGHSIHQSILGSPFSTITRCDRSPEWPTTAD